MEYKITLTGGIESKEIIYTTDGYVETDDMKIPITIASKFITLLSEIINLMENQNWKKIEIETTT